MKVYKIILPAVAGTFVFGIMPLHAQQAVQRQNTVPPKKKVLLKDFLEQTGQNLGCYFTIESRSATLKTANGAGQNVVGQTEKLIVNQSIDSSSPDTIAQLVKTLQDVLPGAKVFVSRANPKVIHILDASLMGEKDYALNEYVTIKFSGLTGALPHVLGNVTNGRIKPQTMFPNDDMRFDALTKVDVSANHAEARDVLTDFVPLMNYSHIIWLSNTETGEGGRLITTVNYYGPSPRRAAEKR